jgi:Phasin protein
MSNHNKPGGKSGQRKGKPVQASGAKPDQPQAQKPEQPPSPPSMQLECQKPLPPLSQKPAQPESLKPIQPLNHKPVHPQRALPILPQQGGTKPIEPAAGSARNLSTDFQAIATAYSDYTKKSFEETKMFVEKLSGVRSLDKAIEIQTEYAKQAYQTFVIESHKIRELYSDLAKQSFKPFENLAKATQAGR